MDLLIPHLRVQNANALVGQHCVSATPLMAAAMFGHALGRKLNTACSQVAVLHHDAQFLGEFSYGRHYAQQRRGAVFIDDHDYSSRNKHALSLQPSSSAHLCLSLVLRFADGIALSELARLLAGARFAGGQIIEHGPIGRLEAAPPPGYWLRERTDLIDPAAPLESLLAALAERPQSATPAVAEVDAETVDDEQPLVYGWDDPPAADPTSAADQPPNSWLAPAMLGYTLVSSIAHRRGARDGYRHAYAEPLLGLVQFRSTRTQTDIPWWEPAWLDPHTFVIREVRHNSPNP